MRGVGVKEGGVGGVEGCGSGEGGGSVGVRQQGWCGGGVHSTTRVVEVAGVRGKYGQECT